MGPLLGWPICITKAYPKRNSLDEPARGTRFVCRRKVKMTKPPHDLMTQRLVTNVAW
jgi:hypothetical protein